MNKLQTIYSLAAMLALGACADMGWPGNPATTTSTAYAGYGVVQSIEIVKPGIAGSGIGAGTVAGAVVGGIVGNQIGQGSGNTAATVLGAAGGAYAGHELEKRSQSQADAYKLTIRMSDGNYQTVIQPTTATIRVGDRVQIVNGVAQRY